MSARRAVVRTSIAAASVAAAIGVTAGYWASSDPSAAHDVVLVYVGADDCGPCRAWQRADAPAFRSSPEFVRVAYREVKSPSVLDVMHDAYWPEDLRRYREQIGRGAGVPLWFVIADDEIAGQGFGISQWQGSVLPKIRSLLR